MLLNDNHQLAEEESAEEGLEWWLKSDVFDNVLFKQKPKNEPKVYETSPMSPTIMIWNDEDLDNIEMAKIESCSEAMPAPEGNIKYKNYKVLLPTNIPLRTYSPSGDINMTPKKGKTMPKYETNDMVSQRQRLMLLINENCLYAQELKAIIKPTGLNKQNMEALKRANESCIEDYLKFLNSVSFTPSPSFSMFSNEDFVSPPATPEMQRCTKKLVKSCSVEKDDVIKRPNFLRQTSVPNRGDNFRLMSLCDELNMVERSYMRSHTPRTMMVTEFGDFSRPESSLSENFAFRRKPSDSKKAILRSFIQRNMIDRSSHRDTLAKMALAIEEDGEEYENEYITSTKLLQMRLNSMLDEIKEFKDELMEIQDEIQEDDRRVSILIMQSRRLTDEFRIMRFLDNVIALLNNNLDDVVVEKDWPFYTPYNGQKRDSNVNLIV